MNASSISVAEYMTPGPLTIGAKQRLGEARRLMKEHAIRHLPVRDGDKLVGILSDRDLELVLTLAHGPPDVLTVEDAMIADPYATPPSAPLDEVVRVMSERKIGSAVVLEQDRIVGVFTATDAMRALADLLGDGALPARVPPTHEEERARAAVDPAERVRGIVAVTARLPAELSVEEAIGGVMGTLTERLTAGEVRDLFDAMPETLRAMLEPFFADREGRPTMKLDRAEAIARVADRLGVIPAHAEMICEAVFHAVRRELPGHMVLHVARQLPRGLSLLWLATPPVEPIEETTLTPEEARQSVVEEIESALDLPRGVSAEDAFAAVMCALSERLSGGEAREVLLGLPGPLRTLVDRCLLHREERGEVFGKDELLRRVGDHLGLELRDAELVVLAAVAGVKRVLPEKTVLDVASQLPGDLLAFWELPS